MQSGQAREGVLDAEDSCISHLSADISALGIFGRSGASFAPLPNAHARIRSAPPARARKADGLGARGHQAASALWIPSIPGRFSGYPAQGVPALHIHSGTNSVASSRVPSSNPRHSSQTASAIKANQESVPEKQVYSTNAPAARPYAHADKASSAESPVYQPYSRKTLEGPRANWKADLHGWSNVSASSYRCCLLL